MGVAFDNALTRSSKVTVTLATTFFRSLAPATGGVVPGTVGARADHGRYPCHRRSGQPFDLVAGYRSDPASLGTPVAISNTSTTNGITNFAIDSAVKNPVAAGAATTFFVNAKAFSATSGNPLQTVCFYFAAPNGAEGDAADASGAAAGELVKIGCTSTAPTNGVFPNRIFMYSFSWSPPARFNNSDVSDHGGW